MHDHTSPQKHGGIAEAAPKARPAATPALAQGAGNQQLQRALGNMGIRAKLNVSQPSDPEEREADQMADAFSAGHGNQGVIRRQCSGPSCDDNATIQRSVMGSAPRGAPSSALHVDGGLNPSGGAPLARDTRNDFEQFFNTSLSDVRVHSYPGAVSAAQSINARAFTLGSHIAFAPGEYAPHTVGGRRLLAHELTHVVQQGNGRSSEPRVQADGGKITAEDMELIKLWIEESDDPWGQKKGTMTGLPALVGEPMLGGPGAKVFNQWPSKLPGESATDQPDLKFDPEWRSKMQYGTPPRGAFCITSGHQTPQQLWEAHLRREAEWKAFRHKQQLEAAWPGMHKSQHQAELSSQGSELKDDITGGQAMLIQIRLQMFDRVLKQEPASNATFESRFAGPTQEMRETWGQAAQATNVLTAMLATVNQEIPVEVAATFREIYQLYYTSLALAFSAEDRQDARLQASLDYFEQNKITTAPCQSQQCHQPEHSFNGSKPKSSPQLDFVPLSRSGYSPGGFGPGTPLSMQGMGMGTGYLTPINQNVQPAKPGLRQTRLSEAQARVSGEPTRAIWQSVILDFKWSTTEIDKLLRNRLLGDKEGQGLQEQFDFVSNQLALQQKLYAEYPDALKVTAVFYPKNDFTKRTDKQGNETEVAKGIPWQFYLTRTPVPAASNIVPTGYTWELHDLTAPKRKDRTVKTHYQISQFEALGRERGPWQDPLPIDQMDPPYVLFEELNHRDFFPEGVLYWRYPLSAKEGSLDMTDDTPFGVWLERIGMAIALLGTLVSGGLGGPVFLPFLIGTGLATMGRLARMAEMDAHGILTQGDVNRFFWDLALDVVNGLTLGLGRVVQLSAAAGNLVRAGSAARAYFYVRRVQIALDVVNVGIVTHDFVTQYQAILNSKMTAEQKSDALRNLTMMAVLAGGLSIVALRAGVKDWNKRPPLKLDVDMANPSRLIADLEAGADAAEHLATRPKGDAVIVDKVKFMHNGEEHSFALWSDGRITRCSDPPCLQIAESIVSRVRGAMEQLDAESAYLADLAAVSGRARVLREEAERAAQAGGPKLKTRGAELLAQAKQLESEFQELEASIAKEALRNETNGAYRARRLYGAVAMNYESEAWGKYYHWRWNKNTGQPEFRRRNQAVPRREFDPQTGTFFVPPEGRLFVPVDAARLDEIAKTSVSSQYKPARVIDNIDDLHELRPPSQNRPPKDWVLVKINDDNLVQFYTEAVPHGTIFEFPDGSRVWRTADNTIATDGAVRAPIGRRGFEQSKHPQLDAEGLNEGVPVRQTTGVSHQRAHPRGNFNGFELFNHIPLAPTYVNQQLQARGIEMYIDELRKLHPGIDFRLMTEHQLFARTGRQAWIDYHLYVVRDGKPQRLFTLRLGTDYSNLKAPAHYEWRNPPRDPEVLKMLDAPEMDAARKALEDRIRRAREQR